MLILLGETKRQRDLEYIDLFSFLSKYFLQIITFVLLLMI